MMDTVLNLGLNDESVQGPRQADRTTSASRTTPTAASCRCSARSCSTFPATSSRRRCTSSSSRSSVATSTPTSTPTTSRAWSRRSRGSSARQAGVEFPADPTEQLALRDRGRVQVVERQAAPRDYRRMERIADDLGTAVNVQTMVFGNKGDDSGTGVAFTRNPSTGESKPYGDFLVERAGRRRRRRHPHHRAARRDGQPLPRAARSSSSR